MNKTGRGGLKIEKGQKWGRLTARAKDHGNTNPGQYWWFLCDCGEYTSKRVTNVTSGKTSSCGCRKSEYLTHRADEVRKAHAALKYAKKHLLPHQIKHIDKILKEDWRDE